LDLRVCTGGLDPRSFLLLRYFPPHRGFCSFFLTVLPSSLFPPHALLFFLSLPLAIKSSRMCLSDPPLWCIVFPEQFFFFFACNGGASVVRSALRNCSYQGKERLKNLLLIRETPPVYVFFWPLRVPSHVLLLSFIIRTESESWFSLLFYFTPKIHFFRSLFFMLP